jgi:hypothetical protein
MRIAPVWSPFKSGRVRGRANEPPAVPVACPTGRGITGIHGHSRGRRHVP